MVMDDAQEVERNGAAQAVYAKVYTDRRRRVSFGEPEENKCDSAPARVSADSRDLCTRMEAVCGTRAPW